MSTSVAQLPAQASPVPLYYLQVTDPVDLNRYISQYAEASGNELPMEYLQRAMVFQFYKEYRPVAGFILNTLERNPLRYFSYLSENVRQSLLQEEDLAEADFLEITSNWKSSELSVSESRTYYSVMLNQAHRQARFYDKKLLLGGSVIKPIKKLQQRLMNRVIYHGPIDAHRQQTVKEQQPLLKLYVVPVSRVRWRAALILWQRYLGLSLRTIFPNRATVTQATRTS